MTQKKLPLINSAHGSETRNIINELINLFNQMGYTYDDALKKAHDVLDEAQRKSNNVLTEAERVNAMNESVQNQINTLIAESGTSDAEVLQARIDAEGVTHNVLKDRLDKNEEETYESIERTAVLGSGIADSLWQPPTQPDIHSHFSGGDAFERHIYTHWLAMYDELQMEFYDYITKNNKPNLYDARYEFPYYIFTPKKYTKTLIIGSGMHGGEKLAVISLYKFLYHLCHDWKEDASLAYVRNNIRLVVIPYQNPYGVAYNTRKTSSQTDGGSVDINRNFDYKWSESSSTSPTNANYKGVEAFSTLEANYIKEILEEYSDAIAYIDFHNKSAVSSGGGYSTTSYVPSVQPFDVAYLEELKTQLNPQGENYELLAMDNATAFNYAAFNFDMHSFDPEFTPGHMFEAYSAEEMTYALKWYGNIIIQYALLENKVSTMLTSQPFMTVTSINRTAANAYPIPTVAGHSTDNHEIITQLNATRYPTERGYFKVTHNIVYSSTDPNAFVYFSPKIWQLDNVGDFSEDSPKSFYTRRFGVYAKGATDRNTITVIGYIPVERSDFKGYVYSQLMGYVTSGEATILKAQTLIEFTPTRHPERISETIV